MTTSHSRLRARRTRHDRGQGLVLLSVFLVVLVGLVGLGVDGGSLYMYRRQAQNAADAAALAGAFTLAKGDKTGTDIANAICKFASTNYVGVASTGCLPDGSGKLSACYTAYTKPGDSTACIAGASAPPSAPPGTATGVQVTTTRQASTLFLPILGFNNIQVQGVAGAHGTPSAPGGPGYGMFALERGQPKGSKVIDWSGSSWTEFGTIHSNSDIDMSGSSNTIGNSTNPSNVEYFTAVNPTGLTGKATLSPSTNNPVQSAELSDPVNKSLSDFYQGTTSTSTYHYIDLGGSNTPTDLSAFITNGVLQSGTYYVKGNINLAALSTTTPSTVTLVATGSIQSSKSIDLLPFDPSKMLFFANISKSDAPGGNGLQISSPSGSWDGIAYAPNSRLAYSGSGSLISKGSIVAFDIKLSGSSGTLKYDPSYFGTPSVAQIFLYQ